MKKLVKISVKNLVGFFLRSGHLGPGQMMAPHGLEAIRAHQQIQNSRGDDYFKEVSLIYKAETEKFILEIRGRIDGLFIRPEATIIEEIKTTNNDLDEMLLTPNSLHWGQAKCYGFIYAQEQGLSQLRVKLVYYRLTTGEIRETEQDFSFQELTDFFNDLVDRYIDWMNRIIDWRDERNASIRKLEFPFEQYRPGQRQMAVQVYDTIREKQVLMVQAPTGIGKTMSALFPTIKAMGEALTEGFFYLTARTTGRYAAADALNILREKGLKLKSLALTAKEKICLNPDRSCAPQECGFADRYYDRLLPVLEALFEMDDFDLDNISKIAQRHCLCPHEFALELMPWVDCVIGDYNYLFDPRAHLREVFDKDNVVPCTLLIDEAHNLVDRAREMYSAELRKKALWDLKKVLEKEFPVLARNLRRINSWMAAAKKEAELSHGISAAKEVPEQLVFLLKEFINIVQHWLARNNEADWLDDLLEQFFSVSAFIKIAETYDENYVTIGQTEGRDYRIRLFCLDPATQIQGVLKRVEATVFFSGTLLPMGYFKDLFGLQEDSPVIYLPSPFPQDNLCLAVAGHVSTRYVHRDKTSPAVASLLRAMIEVHQGKVIFYFPSYEYMNKIYDVFVQEGMACEIVKQVRGMGEAEREGFLEAFSEEGDRRLIGFAVMGGIFAEGIDLSGARLTGAAVVGLGLPGISHERDLILAHFNEKGKKGFEFAYLFPGLNRLFQAAGRVIRSETDCGTLLLIDDRLSFKRYRSYFPSHWQPVMIHDEKELQQIFSSFWDRLGVKSQ